MQAHAHVRDWNTQARGSTRASTNRTPLTRHRGPLHAPDAFVNYLTRIEARVDKAAASATKRLSDVAPSPEAEAAEGETSTASVTVEVKPIEVLQDLEMRKTLGPVARALLRPGVGGKSKRRAPKMYIKDEHVDVCCRFTFLPAFVITVLVYVARLPPMPGMAPAIVQACADA